MTFQQDSTDESFHDAVRAAAGVIAHSYGKALESVGVGPQDAAQEIEAIIVRHLADFVYIGEHYHPGLTWKERCQELVSDLRKCEQQSNAKTTA